MIFNMRFSLQDLNWVKIKLSHIFTHQNGFSPKRLNLFFIYFLSSFGLFTALIVSFSQQRECF